MASSDLLVEPALFWVEDFLKELVERDIGNPLTYSQSQALALLLYRFLAPVNRALTRDQDFQGLVFLEKATAEDFGAKPVIDWQYECPSTTINDEWNVLTGKVVRFPNNRYTITEFARVLSSTIPSHADINLFANFLMNTVSSTCIARSMVFPPAIEQNCSVRTFFQQREDFETVRVILPKATPAFQAGINFPQDLKRNHTNKKIGPFELLKRFWNSLVLGIRDSIDRCARNLDERVPGLAERLMMRNGPIDDNFQDFFIRAKQASVTLTWNKTGRKAPPLAFLLSTHLYNQNPVAFYNNRLDWLKTHRAIEQNIDPWLLTACHTGLQWANDAVQKMCFENYVNYKDHDWTEYVGTEIKALPVNTQMNANNQAPGKRYYGVRHGLTPGTSAICDEEKWRINVAIYRNQFSEKRKNAEESQVESVYTKKKKISLMDLNGNITTKEYDLEPTFPGTISAERKKDQEQYFNDHKAEIEQKRTTRKQEFESRKAKATEKAKVLKIMVVYKGQRMRLGTVISKMALWSKGKIMMDKQVNEAAEDIWNDIYDKGNCYKQVMRGMKEIYGGTDTHNYDRLQEMYQATREEVELDRSSVDPGFFKHGYQSDEYYSSDEEKQDEDMPQTSKSLVEEALEKTRKEEEEERKRIQAERKVNKSKAKRTKGRTNKERVQDKYSDKTDKKVIAGEGDKVVFGIQTRSTTNEEQASKSRGHARRLMAEKAGKNPLFVPETADAHVRWCVVCSINDPQYGAWRQYWENKNARMIITVKSDGDERSYQNIALESDENWKPVKELEQFKTQDDGYSFVYNGKFTATNLCASQALWTALINKSLGRDHEAAFLNNIFPCGFSWNGLCSLMAQDNLPESVTSTFSTVKDQVNPAEWYVPLY